MFIYGFIFIYSAWQSLFHESKDLFFSSILENSQHVRARALSHFHDSESRMMHVGISHSVFYISPSSSLFLYLLSLYSTFGAISSDVSSMPDSLFNCVADQTNHD